MVAGDREVQYVENQRTQMELAVRTGVLAMVAAVLTAGLMWRHGPWLALALGPYAISYLSYRGAIVAAHEYGIALTVLIELNRFTLYERLHLKLPETLGEEQVHNRSLMALLRSSQPGEELSYTHPDTENPAPGSPGNDQSNRQTNDETP